MLDCATVEKFRYLIKHILAWDTTSVAPVAMDTSSPWGQQPQGGETGETGWADFGAFSSGGGEGMEGFLPQGEESMDDGKGEGWSPAMASSPEATMLDCATVEPCPALQASSSSGHIRQ